MTKLGLEIRAPETRKFWLGIVCASAIPVVIGILFFIEFLFVDKSPSRYEMAAPLALTFTLVTPLVAYLSARRVRWSQPLSFYRVFGIALKNSTAAQFICGAVHIILMISLDPYADGMFVGFGIFFHALLWGIVTVPLTLVCALIFRMVSLTKRALVKTGEIFS